MTHIDAPEVAPDALGPKRPTDLRDFNPAMVEKFSSKFSIFCKNRQFRLENFPINKLTLRTIGKKIHRCLKPDQNDQLEQFCQF